MVSLHMVCLGFVLSLPLVASCMGFTSGLRLVYTFSDVTEIAGSALRRPRQVDDLGGDPPEVDQGLHWHDREPCPFTREEGEVYGTYVASSMSRNEGDDMLKWACNRAYARLKSGGSTP